MCFFMLGALGFWSSCVGLLYPTDSSSLTKDHLRKITVSGFGVQVLAVSRFIIDRLHPTRTTGFRSTGFVRQNRQIKTNKDN